MIRRGVILPVVLLTLLLLGLLCAMFAFRVNADLSATQAIAYRLQTRLAAEAGIDRVKMLLRADRTNPDRWYHNPDELHRIIVWAHDVDRSVWGTNEELDEGWMAYRFSIVADDPWDDEDHIRIGITDEASKLNLNYATEAQLMTLVRAAVANNEEVDPGEIVAAILDWRDEDQVSQSEAGDTEGDYYLALDDPYPVKNGPFDTVEELLLVKGVTGAILYGEDFDRNGLLTDNEDDGDDSFPPDDRNKMLNRGLYPFLTVHSYENNVSNDNRPRIYLLGEEALVRSELGRVFEDDPGLVDYIVSAARGSSGPAGGGDESGGDESGGDESAGDESAGDENAGGDASGQGGDDNAGIPDDSGDDSGPAGDGSIDSGDGVDDPKADGRRQRREAGDEPGDEAGSGEEGGDEPAEADEAGDGGETDDAGGASGPIRT
ncbi:MAG: general secretion pathway protein GspK, partial [Planctomycetes bacterium]|nr:general secretion pathway protein GspK [Planctomycetota bacterium]